MIPEIRTTVMIPDATGFTQLELTRAEAIDLINQHPHRWVYVGNQLVQPAELNDVQWGADTILVMPSMGG